MISKFSPSASSFKKDAPKISARYPEANFDADTDYVKITFYDYIAPFSTEGAGAAGITTDAAKSFAAYNSSAVSIGTATSTLYLYMPEDMSGQYGGNWDQMNLSTVARGALGGFGQAAGDKYDGALKTALDTALTTGGNFLTKGTGVANAISDILSKTNFGSVSVNDVFSAATGQVLNPNTEVLYKGPKMRTFDLNFKMAPRNSKEADSIKKIIHAFKYASLPRYGGAGDQAASFVKVPQLVDVTFMKGGSEHPWVTQYKPSVITNFDVSYTPDGAWATLPNGSPVATTIKISFLETKMVYADEVSGTGATY